MRTGRKLSLQHDGNTMQLSDGNKTPVTCSETAATA